MSAIVWPFVIYFLVFFVACYATCEVFQDWFYDEVTPRVGLKVAVGSVILAGLATWLKPSFDTMFTSDFAWTALQAIAWFGVFVLALQFHPPHALALSLVLMVLVCGLATMGVESLTRPSRTVAPVRSRTNNQPIRKSLGGGIPPAAKQAPAK